MKLDLPTLLLVMLLCNLTLALAVLVDTWRSWADGLATWGLGLLLYGLSVPVFALRFAGWEVLSVIGSNLLVAATLSLHLLALRQFQGERLGLLPLSLVWMPPLAVGLGVLLLQEQHKWRAIFLAFLYGVQAALLAWQAWAPGIREARERGRILLACGASALVLMFTTRAVTDLLASDWNNPVMVPPQLAALTYLVSLLITLVNTIGYVLMQKERATNVQHALATHDLLTGVGNRLFLMESMVRDLSLATRQKLPVSVLMLDVDFFKKVNDAHGHLAGDAVLCEVARRIGACLRRQDLLGRYGGEEFVVLLPGTGLEGALVVAEDIRQAVQREPIRYEGRDIAVTVSAGVHCRVPKRGGAEAEDMLAASDRVMYAAKQNGRNRVEVAN